MSEAFLRVRVDRVVARPRGCRWRYWGPRCRGTTGPVGFADTISTRSRHFDSALDSGSSRHGRMLAMVTTRRLTSFGSWRNSSLQSGSEQLTRRANRRSARRWVRQPRTGTRDHPIPLAAQVDLAIKSTQPTKRSHFYGITRSRTHEHWLTHRGNDRRRGRERPTGHRYAPPSSRRHLRGQ